MALTKRLRYEVLRRDNHTCRYCGASAPDATLSVDHVVPQALGGTDEPTNLVTACQPCNSGKAATTPDAPLVDDVAADALRWAKAMAYAAQQLENERRWRDRDRATFLAIWNDWTYKVGDIKHTLPLDDDWATSVDRFLAAGLSMALLKDCVETAMRSQAGHDRKWRYFCGVAWSRLRDAQDLAAQVVAYELEKDA